MPTEGYWRKTENPDRTGLPFPKAREKPWNGRNDFMDRLLTIEYKAERLHCKGWSNCRICGKKNGSVEYKYLDWSWPCGLGHYVMQHNVKPSQEFIKFITEN